MVYIRKIRASKLLKALFTPITKFLKGLRIGDRSRFRVKGVLDVRRKIVFTDEIESGQYSDGRVEPLAISFTAGTMAVVALEKSTGKRILRKGIIGYPSFVHRIGLSLQQPTCRHSNTPDSEPQDELAAPIRGTAEVSEYTSVLTTIRILAAKSYEKLSLQCQHLNEE
jgi:hypothetical protein